MAREELVESLNKDILALEDKIKTLERVVERVKDENHSLRIENKRLRQKCGEDDEDVH